MDEEDLVIWGGNTDIRRSLTPSETSYVFGIYFAIIPHSSYYCNISPFY